MRFHFAGPCMPEAIAARSSSRRPPVKVPDNENGNNYQNDRCDKKKDGHQRLRMFLLVGTSGDVLG